MMGLLDVHQIHSHSYLFAARDYIAQHPPVLPLTLDDRFDETFMLSPRK